MNSSSLVNKFIVNKMLFSIQKCYFSRGNKLFFSQQKMVWFVCFLFFWFVLLLMKLMFPSKFSFFTKWFRRIASKIGRKLPTGV